MNRRAQRREEESAEQQAPEGAGPTDYVGPTDYAAELERLADLRSRDLITEEEYAAKKKQILGI